LFSPNAVDGQENSNGRVVSERKELKLNLYIHNITIEY
jgi:hypothetical protein